MSPSVGTWSPHLRPTLVFFFLAAAAGMSELSDKRVRKCPQNNSMINETDSDPWSLPLPESKCWIPPRPLTRLPPRLRSLFFRACTFRAIFCPSVALSSDCEGTTPISRRFRGARKLEGYWCWGHRKEVSYLRRYAEPWAYSGIFVPMSYT